MKSAIVVAVLCSALQVAAQPYFVSPSGDDRNPGTFEKPFASLERAQQAMRRRRGDIVLRGGTYHLPAPLVFAARDSGAADSPAVIRNYGGEIPVISGGIRLANLDWKPFRNGIFQAAVPASIQTEELFVNGERQVLARYPNYDPTAQYFDGYAADAIAPERIARWADPAGAYFHAMHQACWGDLAWRITGKDACGRLCIEGGWQNNRGSAAHAEFRFVENVFEELDAPGEWYLDGKTHTLFYFPPVGLDLRNAVVEAARLRTLVEFRGDARHPVKWIIMRGLVFRHAARTFMNTSEPLLRSDWTIYRGGAVFFNGAEDCALEDCFIDRVGGNAVFASGYNRRITVRGTHIAGAGASGVCFVGDPKAARSPLFGYDQVNELARIDRTPGPRSDDYPAECLVDDCLIHAIGRVEKQTAGVEIDLARDITVRQCSIYDVPRAGINIGNGCWGGHIVEFCDVFDTVKETGDHGAFNSWGRDRFWRPNTDEVEEWVKQAPDLPGLDVVRPILLANNRWRCDRGWAIDLDDGSSFYIIRNNLCLHGGIKNREGFGRVVENNVLVDGGFDPHVWYPSSGDIFRRNIVWDAYRPANMGSPPWGADMDFNLVHAPGAAGSEPAVRLQEQSGRDAHSIVADAQFVNPAAGDYRVKPGSPALALGFANFPMDRFGVQKPELKVLARVPRLPGAQAAGQRPVVRDGTPVDWCGARVRNVRDEGERSVFGLPGVTGVLVLEVPVGSALHNAGLREKDVILSLRHERTPDTLALIQLWRILPANQPVEITIFRGQKDLVLRLNRLSTPSREEGAPRERSGCDRP